MGVIVGLIQFVLIVVGFITVLILAIGVWDGYVIRQVQDLRRKRAQHPQGEYTYNELKRQEDQLMSLVPVESVRQS